MLKKNFWCLLLLLSYTVISQNYQRVPNVDLKGGYSGFATFVDYNSDGLNDVFVTGVDFGQNFTNAVLYDNHGDDTFTESTITNIPRIIYGDHSWGDFDNNGTLDLIYAGTTSGFAEENITRIYKNSLNGCEFIEIPHSIPALYSCSVEWIDVNNDGLLDIYYHGINSNNEFNLGIHRNNGDGSFSEIPNTGIQPILGSRGNGTVNNAKWADFDDDGLDDIVIAMQTALGFKVEIYKNLGEFNFEKINFNPPPL